MSNKLPAKSTSELRTSLFRQEVVEAKKGSYLGNTLIVTPISFSIWVFCIFFMTTAIVTYLYFGTYSKRQTVEGLLVSDKGLAAVYAQKDGTVTKRFVKQGEFVKQGQLLYLISTEFNTARDQGVSAQQVSLLEKQIIIQKDRLAMLAKNSINYASLFKQHFIAEQLHQQKQDDYLAAKLVLGNYERELNQVKSSAEYTTRAQCNGTITMLIAMTGEHVTASTRLGTITPETSKLEGLLLVPTSKAGFLKIGQKVLVKYRAYPYQRFGLYEAAISSIDQNIINPQDTRDLKALTVPVRMDEAFYRVAGMLFDGIILGEKRRIWQWVLEPIYSLRGNL